MVEKMALNALFVSIGLFSGFSAHANGLDFLFKTQQGRALNDYRNVLAGDVKAVDLLKQRANKGDRWAAFQYGYLAQTGKLTGQGGKPNWDIAIKAYNLASKVVDTDGSLRNTRGNYLAAYNLGLIYYYGWGGQKASCANALSWFRSATYRSSSNETSIYYPAAVFVGRILSTGCGGVRKDAKEALRYHKMAANKGDSIAMYEVGKAYLYGVGVNRDEFQAGSWLRRAADKWNMSAMLLLSKQLQVKTRFSEPNKAEAAKWLVILGTRKPEYNRQADILIAKLPKATHRTINSSAASWLRTHTKEDKFDYASPVNEDLTK